MQGSQKDPSGGHSSYWCQFECHSLTINLFQLNNLTCACVCIEALFILAKQTNNTQMSNKVKCYAAMESVPIILIEKGALQNRMYNHFAILAYNQNSSKNQKKKE